MDRMTTDALRGRLEQLVRERWRSQDPDVRVSTRLREDGKIDMTVVSERFAGKDGLEREAFFWPVFDPVPRDDLVQMTYCLLLTPEEAARHFATPGPSPGKDNEDAWA